MDILWERQLYKKFPKWEKRLDNVFILIYFINMIIVNLNILHRFMRKYSDSRNSLNAWKNMIEASDFKTSADLKNVFPSASFLSENKVIFNIGGNKYRLLTKINYSTSTIVLWIGTHADYDKIKFK